MRLTITLPARRIALVLSGISGWLCVSSIVGRAFEYELGTHSTYFIYQSMLLINANRENSIPSWYSSSLLLICAAVLAGIAYGNRRSGGPYRAHWSVLAGLFGYLSADEAASIHEKLTAPLRDAFHTSGYLYFAWVLVGAPFVVIVGLAYLKFWLRLPPRTRTLFALAGTLYVSGALGLDAVAANLWYQDGGTSLTSSAIGTVEEFLEMIGTVTFLYALLTYAAALFTTIEIVITPQPDEPSTLSNYGTG
jgi:hypothetical protein